MSTELLILIVSIPLAVWVCWPKKEHPQYAPTKAVDPGYPIGELNEIDDLFDDDDEDFYGLASVTFDEHRERIAEFARRQAESSAGLDTGATRELLTDLEIDFADFGEDVPINVNVAITDVLAQMAVLYSDLDKIDRDFGPTGERGIAEHRAAAAKALRSLLGVERKIRVVSKALSEASIPEPAYA